MKNLLSIFLVRDEFLEMAKRLERAKARRRTQRVIKRDSSSHKTIFITANINVNSVF
jgi:hypothetical protein